jgi:hypothetical protein
VSWQDHPFNCESDRYCPCVKNSYESWMLLRTQDSIIYGTFMSVVKDKISHRPLNRTPQSGKEPHKTCRPKLKDVKEGGIRCTNLDNYVIVRSFSEEYCKEAARPAADSRVFAVPKLIRTVPRFHGSLRPIALRTGLGSVFEELHAAPLLIA